MGVENELKLTVATGCVEAVTEEESTRVNVNGVCVCVCVCGGGGGSG